MDANLSLEAVPAGARVVVAMSGGVDSSVVAALLKARGYDVVGITLQLYDHGAAIQKAGACCAGADIHDARSVADRLGIAHYVLDYESRFRQSVMDDFADSYLAGETPIPCIRCNQRVKFRDLLETARDIGGACLATGHYVRRLAGPDGAQLHAAVDPARDQSYFLFSTTRDQLDYLRFPLGSLHKPDVRALAERFGLPVAAKPDSQDICFVPNGRYADIVARLRPGAIEAGDIVHVDGRVLGRHGGIINYTVGQRRGIEIGGQAEPLYVVALDAAARRVVVGPRHRLAVAGLTLREVNWLAHDIPPDGLAVEVKVRSTGQRLAARIMRAPAGLAVRFDRGEYGVSPGQACVVYDGDRVLGGGWIDATEPMLDPIEAGKYSTASSRPIHLDPVAG